MEHSIAFLLIVILIFSCRTQNVKVSTPENKSDKAIINGTTINVYEIYGCEYIGLVFGENSFLAHKGNCKFCESRRKNENKSK